MDLGLFASSNEGSNPLLVSTTIPSAHGTSSPAHARWGPGELSRRRTRTWPVARPSARRNRTHPHRTAQQRKKKEKVNNGNSCNLHRLWTRASLSGSTRLPDKPDGLQGLRRMANACTRRLISVRQGAGGSGGVVVAPEPSARKPAWSWTKPINKLTGVDGHAHLQLARHRAFDGSRTDTEKRVS